MTNSTPSGTTGVGAGATGVGATTTGMGTGAGVTGVTAVTGAEDTSKQGLRDEASNLAGEAGSTGRRVADVTKEETRAVASETKRQARRLADDARRELRDQAAAQQTRVAGGLRSVGSELSRMADGSTEPGVATDVVREAGRRVDGVARWLDQRDPGSLLQEVKMFARRRPGVFLAIAVGAGVVAGRLTRALATSSEDDERDASTSRMISGAGTYRTTGTAGIDDLPRATTPPGVGTTGGTGTAYGLEGDELTGTMGVEGTGPRTSGTGL
jgi:hypothetical protein